MKKFSDIELDEQRLAEIKGGSNAYGVEKVYSKYLAVNFSGGKRAGKNIIKWFEGIINK